MIGRVPASDRRAFLRLGLVALATPARLLAFQSPGGSAAARPPVLNPKTGAYHVNPGDRIQDALEAAARDRDHKTVYVHAGTYRPAA